MIQADLSNVWTCVSLPELLGSERELFDAHNLLCGHRDAEPDYLGWLGWSETIMAKMIHNVRKTAERICADSDVLVVCGSGGAWLGARAAISAYCGRERNLLGSRPQIFFTGESLSSRAWLELSQLLEDRDYSLHIVSPDGRALASNVASRGIRWMMERKYGQKAKERISVATLPNSPLYKMAQEEGYELFTLPREPGGSFSTLTAGALVPMAAAGIDPLAVLEGAAEAWRELDIRSFDNPLWLYAAARTILGAKGVKKELLCLTDPAMEDFGRWWQRLVWRCEGRENVGIDPFAVMLPGDLEALDQMAASGRGGVFETVLHFEPIAKKVPVEMDWKDYDGLGFLSGRSLDYVDEHTLAAVFEVHNQAGVPMVDLQAGELTAETLGSLFCFFELASALSACVSGADPLQTAGPEVRQCALSNMGAPGI